MIRKMQPDDIYEVAEIEETIFSQPWSASGFSDGLKKEENLYLVAQIDGAIAGYCGLWGVLSEGQITHVGVREKFRGRGIGTLLVMELLKQGEEKGLTEFILEVRESNLIARRLYKKAGFIELGIRKNFYQRPIESAVLMGYAAKQ